VCDTTTALVASRSTPDMFNFYQAKARVQEFKNHYETSQGFARVKVDEEAIPFAKNPLRKGSFEKLFF
jgi:hypothetical protein